MWRVEILRGGPEKTGNCIIDGPVPMKHRAFLLPLVLSSTCALQAAAPSLLEKGVELFTIGDFTRAAATFSEAEKESPDDLRITYNLGAAQAASGNFAGAGATLRKSALSKDAELTVKSLTLIGDIAVAQARLLLAPSPGETSPQDRPTIFEHLAVAERSYIEAVELQPSEDLRRNIEQIRAWKHRAQSAWNLADQEKKRQELELPQRFDWLEQWERKIRTDLKRTVVESDSPKKFQVFYEASKEQQRLLEEFPPLKEALWQTLPEESAAPFVAAIDKLRESAAVVDTALREMRGQSALDVATTTIERLDYLKSYLRSFEAIVQEATTKQEALCKANSSDTDFDEQAWEQEFVAVRMPLMVDKAKQETPGDPERQQQTENLQKAKELAIEYGPEIETLTADAARLLREKEPEAALPKQEQALELLREILKPLQQEQPQQQDKDEKQDQEQKQSGQDSEDRQDRNGEQEQNQSEPKEDNQPSPEEKKSDGKEQTPQEKKEELEKAERTLRQVKRLQQAAEERREKVRALLMQLEPVEKDW